MTSVQALRDRQRLNGDGVRDGGRVVHSDPREIPPERMDVHKRAEEYNKSYMETWERKRFFENELPLEDLILDVIIDRYGRNNANNIVKWAREKYPHNKNWLGWKKPWERF